MDKKITYGVLGLITGLIIGVYVSKVNINPMGPEMMNLSERTAQNTERRSNAIDSHFIEQMIPHHEDAITMAKLAEERAVHPEVKQLSQDIITSQGKEIEQMKEWYKKWFGRELPTGEEVMRQHGMMGSSGLHMGMMGGEMDFESLSESEEFDREFIEQMIPHHQMAVMMASMLKSGTQREEMKKLADDIISAQTREIDQMRRWYSEWGY